MARSGSMGITDDVVRLSQGKRYEMRSIASVYLHTLSNYDNNKDFHVNYNQITGNIIIQRSTVTGSITSINGEKDGEISSSGLQKLQSYPVNYCYLNSESTLDMESYHELFDESRRRAFTLALDLGINSSMWIIGRHISYDYGDLLFQHNSPCQNASDFFSNTFQKLFSELQNQVTSSKYLLRVGFTVKVKCYEVYAEQIRDLLSTDENHALPTIRENKSIPYVDSLVEVTCESADDAYSILYGAYTRRLSLVVERYGVALNSVPHLEKRSFIGYVGNIFIQLAITQTLCSMIPGKSESELIERTGAIQYNILADNDALTYKLAPKAENPLVIPLKSISPEVGSHIISGTSVLVSENFTNSSRNVTQQLLSSAKAISTLFRVVTKLFRDSQNSQSSTTSHISYRDSILTRVLQATLEGNSANCICLYLDLRKDRFGSELTISAQSCSNFLRMMSELHGAIKMSSFLRSSDKKLIQSQSLPLQLLPHCNLLHTLISSEPLNSNALEAEEKIENGLSALSFWHLLDSLRQDLSVSSTISTLLSLEDERNLLLENLGGRSYVDISLNLPKQIASNDDALDEISSPSLLPPLKSSGSARNLSQASSPIRPQGAFEAPITQQIQSNQTEDNSDSIPDSRREKLQSKISVGSLLESSGTYISPPHPPITRDVSSTLLEPPFQINTTEFMSKSGNSSLLEDSKYETPPKIVHSQHALETRKSREKSVTLPQVRGIKDYFDGDDGPDHQSGLSELEIQFLKAFWKVSTSHSSPFTLLCFRFLRDAVQISTRNGSLDILRLLYNSGATLHTRGKRGDTLFHLAAANGHIDVMERLTSVGVMHNMVDITGQTCAHVAARRGEIAVLIYLDQVHQMDFTQKDFDEQTPLDKIPKTSLHGNEIELEETRLFLLSRIEKSL